MLVLVIYSCLDFSKNDQANLDFIYVVSFKIVMFVQNYHVYHQNIDNKSKRFNKFA